MRKLIVPTLAAALLYAAPAQAAFVCGLDPYGDNFLSLREGPGGRYGEIDRLGPRTRVLVRRSSGGWVFIEVAATGATGWAARRYICG